MEGYLYTQVAYRGEQHLEFLLIIHKVTEVIMGLSVRLIVTPTVECG